MSFPSFPGRKMNRTQKPNIKLEDIPMKSIVTLLTTSKGWILRRALNYSGAVLAAFGSAVTAKAASLNLPIDQVQAVLTPFQAFVSAAVVLGVELLLSYLARKNP